MDASFEAAAQAAATLAAGPASSRITAPTDRSTASAVLAAGGGTARLLAGAGSYTASPLAGAEAESIGRKSYCVDPRVARQRHVRVRMCAFLFILFARTPRNTENNIPGTQNRKKNPDQTRTAFSEKYSTRGQGPTNGSTYQQ